MIFKRHESFDGIDQNLVILLHGLGDTADNFIKFGLKLRLPQTSLIAVQGSFKVPFAGWSWFPSFDDQGYNLSESDPMLQSGLLETRTKLLSFIKSLDNWPAERIFLLGFGYGGSVVLDPSSIDRAPNDTILF